MQEQNNSNEVSLLCPLFTAEDDVHDVYEEVFTMAGHWRKIARGLRLSSATISLIVSKSNNDSEDCLFNILEIWLKRTYNTERYGNPSWRMLVKCIANPAGGADPALAEVIAKRHQGKCPTSCILHIFIFFVLPEPPAPNSEADAGSTVALISAENLAHTEQGICLTKFFLCGIVYALCVTQKDNVEGGTVLVS